MAKRATGTGTDSEGGKIADLTLVRAGREGAEAPGRRRGRPYRYDPGPLAKGPEGDRQDGTEAVRDDPWAFRR